jgi:hypothetical protein
MSSSLGQTLAPACMLSVQLVQVMREQEAEVLGLQPAGALPGQVKGAGSRGAAVTFPTHHRAVFEREYGTPPSGRVKPVGSRGGVAVAPSYRARHISAEESRRESRRGEQALQCGGFQGGLTILLAIIHINAE